MCGRFTNFHTWAEIHRLYSLTNLDRGRNTEARYNIAPTQTVDFVTADGGDGQKLREGRWWLVPFWAKEMPKAAMFNARIETVDTSGAFKHAWRDKRCLIPASGFYEWTKSAEDGGKDPWFIHLPDTAPFSFAGLWSYNATLDVTSCTIITMEAGAAVRQLHDRQPVILDPTAYDEWLDPATPGGKLKPLLETRNLDDDLRFYRVSREVNTSKAQGPQLVEPLEA